MKVVGVNDDSEFLVLDHIAAVRLLPPEAFDWASVGWRVAIELSSGRLVNVFNRPNRMFGNHGQISTSKIPPESEYGPLQREDEEAARHERDRWVSYLAGA